MIWCTSSFSMLVYLKFPSTHLQSRPSLLSDAAATALNQHLEPLHFQDAMWKPLDTSKFTSIVSSCAKQHCPLPLTALLPPKCTISVNPRIWPYFLRSVIQNPFEEYRKEILALSSVHVWNRNVFDLAKLHGDNLLGNGFQLSKAIGIWWWIRIFGCSSGFLQLSRIRCSFPNDLSVSGKQCYRMSNTYWINWQGWRLRGRALTRSIERGSKIGFLGGNAVTETSSMVELRQ